MSRYRFAVAMLALGTPGVALAQAETTSYEYDAQGRLTESSREGGPADGTVKTLTYDRAGNRTNQTVTGAPGGAGLAAPAGPGGVSSEVEPQAIEEANATGEAAPADEPPVSQGAPLLDPLDPATSPNGEASEPGA